MNVGGEGEESVAKGERAGKCVEILEDASESDASGPPGSVLGTKLCVIGEGKGETQFLS